MLAFAGIFGTAASDPAHIARMSKPLASGQTGASDTYRNDELGLALCWGERRRGSAAPALLWDDSRQICLLFRGEDFTPVDELARHGIVASEPVSRPRHILALYEKIGPAFVEKLNGWFSGVLIDLSVKRAWLFNDRYGLSRVYHHTAEGGFYFASEAKALLAVLPPTRALDMRSAAEAYVCGSPLQGRTLFERIAQLPGAALWTMAAGRPLLRDSYFSRSAWENQPPMSEPEFHASLEETFKRVLPRYFQGSEAIGMSLTGGLDGRMIMAWAGRAAGTLPCYTFGSAYRDCADVTLARRIAAICGQPHETIVVGDDFLDRFAELAEEAVYISDGAMDVTGAVELYANALARQIAPVRLTGNYGSEIIRSAVALRPQRMGEQALSPDFSRLVAAARDTYDAERAMPVLSFIAFKQVPWHHYARLSVEQSQLTLRSPYLDNELVALMYRAPGRLASALEPSQRLIHDGNPQLGRLPTDRGITYGSETAAAFLNRQMANFSVRAEYAYDYGMPQRLARIDHWLAPLRLERHILGRHKFYHFRVWYRDRLARYVKEVLLDPGALSRPYLKRDAVERMVTAHTQGEENWTLEIHRLLTLELAQRRLIGVC